MRKKSRIAAMLIVAVFLISTMIPALGFAGSASSGAAAQADGTVTITAKVGTDTELQNGAYVTVGTTVSLTADQSSSNPGTPGGDPPGGGTGGTGNDNGDDNGSGRRTARADSYEWSVSPTAAEGSGMPQVTNEATLTVIPTKPGSYTYTCTVGDDSGEFTLNVVNDLQPKNSSVTGKAGTTVQLEAQWGNGGSVHQPDDIKFNWTTDSPEAPEAIGNGLTATVQIPPDAKDGTEYEYTVTPVKSSYDYVPAEITVTVGPNTFAVVSSAASPTPWIHGSATPPTLTATFSEELKSAVWYEGSVSDDNSAEGTSAISADKKQSTFTPSMESVEAWTSPVTYYCVGTNTNGVTATAQVTVSIVAPTRPSVTGSAAIGSGAPYAGPSADSCELQAVTSSPPTLSVTATGGTGGTPSSGSSGGSSSGSGSGNASAADNYTYQWYTAPSAAAVSSTWTPIQNAASNTLELKKGDLAAEDQTAYFICSVGLQGNTDSDSVAKQVFAVTTVAQASLEKDMAETSAEGASNSYPVDVDLPTPITLAVKWNPPVVPSGITGFQWVMTISPAGGQATVQWGTSSNPYTQGGQWTTSTAQDSVQVTKFSAPGTYVITCTPQSSGSRATLDPIEFTLVAGKPSIPDNLTTFYATQASDGTINLKPTTSVSSNTVSTGVNSRVALRVPMSSITGSTSGTTDFVTEWMVKRTPGEEAEPLPSNAGFYGINGETLVTGPITAQMNGWQLSMKVSSKSDPTLSAETPWIRLAVSGTAPSTTPLVNLTSTPAAVGSNVNVAAGANAAFVANVTNTSSIPVTNLAYQWYSQASSAGAIAQAIAGATSSTYSISGVTEAMNGQTYWCVVSNRGHMNEQGTSNRLTLSVNSQPGAVVISEPTGPSLTNLAAGSSVTVQVAATTTDGNTVNYQWYSRRSGNPIPEGTAVTSVEQAQSYLGAATLETVPEGTSSTLTMPSLDAGVYEFQCRVSNSAQPSQSQFSAPYYIAVTSVSTKPVIEAPTAAITYVGGKAGEPLYLTCEAYLPTDASPTYQWQAGASASGPWSDLGTYTEADLRIPSLSDANNGAYYRCVVTNPSTKEATASNPYQVSVWDPSSTPTVVENPQSVSYTVDMNSTTTPADYTGYLQSTATSSNVGGLRSQWQYRPTNGTWVNVPASSISGVSGGTASNGVSKLKLDANPTSQAPNGEYRCVWLTGTQSPTAPLIPQSASLPAVVDIIVPGNPHITTQPVGAAVHVGSTASFSVTADLGETGTIVYVWQTSSDKGKTWRNCTAAADGTGQFTSTFQTYPVTQAMYETLAAASPGNLEDSIYQYRCVVANRAKSLDVVSQPAPLVIMPGAASTPLITPGSGSSLTVTGTGGARYAEGIKVSKYGTPVSTFLRDLRYTAPGGYTLQLLTQSGQEVESDEPVATGMKLVLVQTVTEETVDTVNVVVQGDVLGSGVMGLSQLVRMAAAYRGREQLSGAFYQAALLTGRSTIQLSDLVAEATLYKDAQGSGSEGSSTASPAPSASASAEASPSSSASAEAS